MVFVAVEVSPVGSKPPAADVVRIYKSERHDLGAAAPFSTTTSFLQGKAGGSTFTPKLVELIYGSRSNRLVKSLSPRIACTAVAAPSVRSRVFLSPCPSATLARRGCRGSCYRHA